MTTLYNHEILIASCIRLTFHNSHTYTTYRDIIPVLFHSRLTIFFRQQYKCDVANLAVHKYTKSK
jgi:hypothetical protein